MRGRGDLKKLPRDHGGTLWKTPGNNSSLYTYVVDENNAFEKFVQCLIVNLKIQSLLLCNNKRAS